MFPLNFPTVPGASKPACDVVCSVVAAVATVAGLMFTGTVAMVLLVATVDALLLAPELCTAAAV